MKCLPKSMLANLILSSACICSSTSNSYYAWREYDVSKSNWCGMLIWDIWAQLYSIEMTSKPYFREQKHVYLYLMVHPFCYVVCSAGKWANQKNKSRARCCNDHTMKRKRVKSDFISCLRRLYVVNVALGFEPISHHCPFREASANQEALQGPIPKPTNLIASSPLLPWRLLYLLLVY